MVKINSASGLENPLQEVFPRPIVSSRRPTANDTNYALGQIWVDKLAGSFFGLSSVTAGAADWEDLGGSTSTLNSLSGDSGTATPSSSNIQIAGGTNITTSGATSIITVDLDAAITLATSLTTPLIIGGGTGSIALQLGDAAGADALNVTDSTTATIWTVNSDGDMTANGPDHILGNATVDSTVQLCPGTGINTISINNGINTGANITNVNSGASAANSTVNILDGLATAGSKTLNVATDALAVDCALNFFTGTSTAGTQTFNVMTGTRGGSINLGTGTATHVVSIGSGAAGPVSLTSSDSIGITSFFSNPLAINLVAQDAAGGITLHVGTANMNLEGNFSFSDAGNKILSANVATTTTAGANSFGTVTLVGGTATISTTAVTAASLIITWRQSIGSTGAAALGMVTAGTIVAGVSFVINAVTTADATALATTDVSSIGWTLIN